MPTLLALDASTQACSAALMVHREGRDEVISRFSLAPREHTRRLMPMVEELLAEAGIGVSSLDAVAYGRGPGSFTGLRIAAGTAQGLAFGADRPLLGVSTLEALALRANRHHHVRHVLAALDARMGEIYVAAYRCHDDGLERLLDEAVLPPERLTLPSNAQDVDWVGVGSGWTLWDAMPVLLQDAMSQTFEDMHPAAEEMAWLAARQFAAGEAREAHLIQPIYLRDQVAWQKNA
ncbi:tRNA (adenosine(37)-N6)-threonylcarbamoyltransferase complex dimerization subunit type 1 TsaB [Litchfieldella xinjiangensis]|uniref:tRNA (adenosine(37)-N6)-threonylcarbamoyltransferase complex dimerization subunit type 1 TsaB n=1 Tax=Litchfieldella xinjiangensis TaxID=1166948 RepID=UPI0005BC7541|nr:tRNA (adenosine(37)-N6)-threonylcarbamoyltransferase complex dimerization subunit type 1 TsaB [Halomonas xinjiangensis]